MLFICYQLAPTPLQWRNNERHGVSNHQRLHSLLNCWFRGRSKKTPKLCVTGLCAGNSPVTGEFPAQKASNAENVSIWWRHRDNSVSPRAVDNTNLSSCGPGYKCSYILFSAILHWVVGFNIREWESLSKLPLLGPDMIKFKRIKCKLCVHVLHRGDHVDKFI